MTQEYSKITNFPKLHSPFIRKTIDNNHVVTSEIDEDYKWVFEDAGVMAVDKIDGTNICVRIKNGKIQRIFNRTHEKFIFNVLQTSFEGVVMEGLAKAIQRGWLKVEDGDHYGELIGKTINSNRHQLQDHLFVPFNYLKEHCFWKSWVQNKYPKDYDTIREWFKDGIISLFNQRMCLPEIKAEGLVFYHVDGRMAKLRLDMWDFYKDKRH